VENFLLFCNCVILSFDLVISELSFFVSLLNILLGIASNPGSFRLNFFREGVSKALEMRVTEFAGTALPSAKSSCAQFEKLLRERQDAKKNHKFKSGTTEELDEIACGLEDIMREMEEVLDENNAKDDCDTKVEADQRV
jgi:hypothetical protein